MGRKPCLRHCQGSSVVFGAGFLLWASAGSVAFRSSHSVGVYPDTKWICISFPILSSRATACFIPLRHLHGLWFDPVFVRRWALAVFHYRSSRPALSQGLSIHRCWDIWYELRFYQRVWKLLSCSCLQEHWLGMACSPHRVSNQQCTNIAQVANRKKQQQGNERLSSTLALQHLERSLDAIRSAWGGITILKDRKSAPQSTAGSGWNPTLPPARWHLPLPPFPKAADTKQRKDSVCPQMCCADCLI